MGGGPRPASVPPPPPPPGGGFPQQQQGGYYPGQNGQGFPPNQSYGQAPPPPPPPQPAYGGGQPAAAAATGQLSVIYNGQRFHRAEPKFLVQIGDPVSRDVSREEWWGRQGTGKPIGVAEVTKKRGPVLGAVGMAYPGTDKLAADSQFFILRRNAPELQGKYTIFGKVLTGMDVVQKLQKGDMLKRASVK